MKFLYRPFGDILPFRGITLSELKIMTLSMRKAPPNINRNTLYKYTRLQYVNSTLNRGIYASNLLSLNDPYERNGIEDKDSDIRVVCLTRSRNQKKMWSHYADGHKGCSIKIALPDDYGTETSILRRVEYTSQLIRKKKKTKNEIINALYIKDKKWENELEVRAVYYKGLSEKGAWKKAGNNIYYKVTIEQIDFGCYAEFDPHYLDALIAIRDYNKNHKKKIKVRKYKMSDKRFEFIIDKNFNFDNEINNVLELKQ